MSMAEGQEWGEPGVTYRPIPSAKGYWAGSDGSIWSQRRGRPIKLKLAMNKTNRRLYISPYGGRQRQVAHLVLEAFVGPRQPGMEACHFPDRTPSNNAITNLRWDTRRENIRDAQIHKVGTLSTDLTPSQRRRIKTGKLLATLLGITPRKLTDEEQRGAAERARRLAWERRLDRHMLAITLCCEASEDGWADGKAIRAALRINEGSLSRRLSKLRELGLIESKRCGMKMRHRPIPPKGGKSKGNGKK